MPRPDGVRIKILRSKEGRAGWGDMRQDSGFVVSDGDTCKTVEHVALGAWLGMEMDLRLTHVSIIVMFR